MVIFWAMYNCSFEYLLLSIIKNLLHKIYLNFRFSSKAQQTLMIKWYHYFCTNQIYRMANPRLQFCVHNSFYNKNLNFVSHLPKIYEQEQHGHILFLYLYFLINIFFFNKTYICLSLLVYLYTLMFLKKFKITGP